MKAPKFVCFTTAFLAIGALPQVNPHEHSFSSEEGFGRVHMDISCSAKVAGDFDRALALLHNFWYVRALERFNDVAKNDPKCAMAYWGAAMTYNHPFWDPPSQSDETAAWTLVQKGLSSPEASAREKLYLAAVAALYKDAGAGAKSVRDRNYRDAMGRAYAQFPDDETALFYGLSILGATPEGSTGFEDQGKAAQLFEAVYARHPDHPGVLHYLIHSYDDPTQNRDCRQHAHTRRQPQPYRMPCTCPRTYSRGSAIGKSRPQQISEDGKYRKLI
jgi:hypothetical protein